MLLLRPPGFGYLFVNMLVVQLVLPDVSADVDALNRCVMVGDDTNHQLTLLRNLVEDIQVDKNQDHVQKDLIVKMHNNIKDLSVTMTNNIKDLIVTMHNNIKDLNVTMHNNIKDLNVTMHNNIKDLTKQLSSLESGIKEVKEEVVRRSFTRRDCSDLLASGITASGLYEVYPSPSSPATIVYCDQETEGGGWTVIQRRENNKIREDFYRTWREYRLGFGNISGEFWLGNDIIHHLTNIKPTELRIDLEDYNNNHRWAKYGTCYVDNQLNKYKLTATNYSGNAGDALLYHDGAAFSTYDSDNDSESRNCAEVYKGGWWYNSCHNANLNGLPHIGEHGSDGDGINYGLWLGNKYSLKKTTMMIRPVVRVHE